tara:strand:- start:915 stop:1364 length:450 start_codon:yes stop_codon:yes gene_type:complete
MRKDWSSILFGPRKPFFSDGSLHIKDSWSEKNLIILPQPTNQLRFACWHTIGYMFGWDFHYKLLQECLDNSEFFYYLIHPGDFLIKEDLDSERKTFLDRIDYSLDYKMDKLDKALRLIKRSGRELVSMEELASISKKKLLSGLNIDEKK